MNEQTSFATSLLQWHSTIDRKLPWKEAPTPYKIWLSEIIMQQTRVAQGTPYYVRFVQQYPTVTDLADAPEDDVLRLWQGLGYYSRARNLHKAAKIIRDAYGGIFPRSHEDILDLPGVGAYTAAAIASFAYGDEYPVVDGNVIRVLSRYYGITDPVDHNATLKSIRSHATALIRGADPAGYNQAIMDFGAMHCTPKSPSCGVCPFADSCKALADETVGVIPYKAKKIKKTTRYLHYYLVHKDGALIIKQRKDQDIWKGLYDFICIELDDDQLPSLSALQTSLTPYISVDYKMVSDASESYKHLLTHQTIFARFYELEALHIKKLSAPYRLVSWSDLQQYGLPRLLVRYLEDRQQKSLW